MHRQARIMTVVTELLVFWPIRRSKIEVEPTWQPTPAKIVVSKSSSPREIFAYILCTVATCLVSCFFVSQSSALGDFFASLPLLQMNRYVISGGVCTIMHMSYWWAVHQFFRFGYSMHNNTSCMSVTHSYTSVSVLLSFYSYPRNRWALYPVYQRCVSYATINQQLVSHATVLSCGAIKVFWWYW